MKSKEELKKLFENGDKPTQEEFWEWQDSYWHKGEKLPIETAGLYKIKGSVPDLTTLNYMSNMSEGDVYNVIETGDNYVYVLNLNNMGEAGWDKLGGLSDLSAINLQTVLDNGSYANDKSGSSLPSEMNLNLPLKTINWSLWGENASSTSSFVHDVNKLAGEVLNNGSFVGFNADSNLSHVRLYAGKQSMKSEVALKHDTALTYLADYSSKFSDRSLVDKAYVNNNFIGFTETNLPNANGDVNYKRYLVQKDDGTVGYAPKNLQTITPRVDIVDYRDDANYYYVKILVTNHAGSQFSSTNAQPAFQVFVSSNDVTTPIKGIIEPLDSGQPNTAEDGYISTTVAGGINVSMYIVGGELRLPKSLNTSPRWIPANNRLLISVLYTGLHNLDVQHNKLYDYPRVAQTSRFLSSF